ncbi:universal stress protein, partial [Haladaptatus sp.]
MYDSILVPTDGSGGEQQFVEEAISLAELTGATVHV